MFAKKEICVVGIGTGCGKTYITCNLIKTLINIYKFRVAALKPIATGLIKSNLESNQNTQTINEDAYNIHNAINVSMAIADINPILFKKPIAPHIAANLVNYPLNIQTVLNKTNNILNKISNKYDYLIIEGVGGILVPLNIHETYLDLLKNWQYPVILVAGLTLGALNHTLLTTYVLTQNNIPVIGWIANYIDPQLPYPQENFDYLVQKIPYPLLAINQYNSSTLELTPEFLKTFAC